MKRIALVLVLTGGLLTGCGLTGSTDEAARSAGITPPDVLAFVSLSLDPSIEQKRNLLSIAEAFPKADIKEEFDESRDDILRDLSEEAGLDYETQVEPVIGAEIALAVFPPGEGQDIEDLPAALIIEIEDREAAEKLVTEGSEGAAYRIVGDHLLATQEGADADEIFDRFSARGEGGGLSAKPEFERLTGELHGDRLLLGWVDVPRLVALGQDVAEDELPFGGFDPWESLGTTGPAAFDLHAEKGSMVFEAVAAAHGDQKAARPVLTEGLPADLLGALTMFDFQSVLGEVVESLTDELGDESGVNDITGELGLDPKRDILPWWGGEVVLAVGDVNQGEGYPDVALLVVPSDRAAAEAALPRLQRAFELTFAVPDGGIERSERSGYTVYAVPRPEEGLQAAFALLDDRFIFASSPEYLEEVARKADAPLSESEAYESVIDPGTSAATQSQLVLDIDKVREALEQTFGIAEDDDYVTETKPNIEPFDMLGVRAARVGDLNRFRMELTFS